MKEFRNTSISKKLTILMMVTVTASLLLASISFVVNDWLTYKQLLVKDLTGSAQVVGTNSQAALLFNDEKSAAETLAALRARSNIIAAGIYDSEGELFATYTKDGYDGDLNLPPMEIDGYQFYERYVDLYSGINLDNEKVGTVLIRADLKEMQARLYRYLGIVTLVLVASLCLGYILSSKLRRLITDPIVRLSITAKSITHEKDYSVRAIQDSEDEIGTLISGFNEMLAEIQARDHQLEDQRQHLEDKVTLRTAELSKSNKQLQKEVVERKHVQEVRQRYHDGMVKLDKWMRKLIAVAGHQQEFYDIVCAGITDLVNADIATLPLLDDARVKINYVAAIGKNAEEILGSTVAVADAELEGWVIRQQEVLCLSEGAQNNLPIPDCMKSWNVTSCLVVPMLHSEQVIGTLHACRCGGAFDVVDEQILSLFGQRVATALDNLRLLLTLEEEKERAEVTLHSIGDAVIATNGTGLVTFLNPIAEQLTGWSSIEANGVPVSRVFKVTNETSGDAMEDPATRCLREGKIIELSDDALLINRDGNHFAINDSAAPILDKKGKVIGVVMVFNDVSKERDLKNQLSWQAAHDSLTGLVNRREFERRLDKVLANVKHDDSNHALLYLDLDQFKIVNDTCGHVAGDELLRQLAALLQQNIRSSDTLSRLGGDEFGVLLEGCPFDQATQIAEVLRKSINEFRFGWENQTFDVGVSIGMVPIDASSGAKGDVLSIADVACYTAKDLGRNRVHIYKEEDADQARRHGEMRWVSRITAALRENRLVLYQQKIVPVNAPSLECHHYEILLRMRDEDNNIIPPGAFIPAAERYNLMPAIDRWVIRNTFANYQPGTMYSINLSGTSLNEDDLLTFIKGSFDRYSVPPEAICFEVTETSAISNLSNASDFIRELKEMGCMFALDDFGSGLSSFAYLKNLPVDFLKIDGQFVKGMITDPIDRAMVRSICEIGHEMGIRTIAEFVESATILAGLHELGVDYAQGYAIGKPEPMSLSGEKIVVNSK